MSATPYLPPLLPLTVSDDAWGSFGMLEFNAVSSLAELNGMMQASAKADLFWLTWLLQEARSSNVIEGTVTTFEEILGENAGVVVPAERQDDVREVINYKEATEAGLQAINNGRDITLSLVKSLHALLLEGARGEKKNPGQYRTIQVHIGRPGSTPETATYIPPDSVHVPALLENWEKFLRRTDLNPLIQAAVMHAQFEMIHPFCDGNGRMGRLLITLLLAEKKLLAKPCFYMSAYLQEHRTEYYTALGNISQQGSWKEWIEFFLNAVILRSKHNKDLLTAMNALYEHSKNTFPAITGSANAVQILDYMFSKPLFTQPDLQKYVGTARTRQGFTNILHKLEQAGIIAKSAPGKGRTPAVWKFTALMELLS